MSFGLILALGACGYIPRTVEGVPSGPPWQALPLRKWLAEGRAEPEAMAFCAPPQCRPGLAVGVLRLTGKDAQEAWAVLEHPADLARELETEPKKPAAGKTKPVRPRVAARPFADGPYRGFTISLAAADGRKAPAYGAALGLRAADALRVVLVIGGDELSVQSTARSVAKHELRP